VAEVAPAAEPEAEAEPQAGVRYDKGFILSSGDDRFELKLALRTQVRLEVTKPDASDEYVAAFSLPRVRLQTEGFAYGKANTYKLEFDFASRGNANLRDFWIDHAFGAVHVRGGQWKRPFQRSQIASDFGLQLIESSPATAFTTDRLVRDLGVAVHNDYEKSPEGLEWVAGFFNGTGEASRQKLTCEDPADPEGCAVSTPTNVPADYDPMLLARVDFNHGGIKGYSEGDVEGGPLRFAVAGAYKLDLDNFDKNADDELVLGHAGTIDGVLKVEGFSVAGAVGFVKVGEADADLTFFGQTGYLIIPKTLELAGRFAQNPEAAGSDDSLQEILGGLNWYLEGHSFKWMLDGGVVHHTAAGGAIDQQVRTQVQLVF
jgi:hypothetical protein